jgi:hypothetical protein
MAPVRTVITTGQNTTNGVELHQSYSAYFQLLADDHNGSAREAYLPMLEFTALRA